MTRRRRFALTYLGLTLLVATIAGLTVTIVGAGASRERPVSVLTLAKNLRSVYNQRAATQHVPVRAVASSCKPRKDMFECRLVLLAAPSGVHCSRLYVKANSHGFKVISFGADPYCPEGDKL